MGYLKMFDAVHAYAHQFVDSEVVEFTIDPVGSCKNT